MWWDDQLIEKTVTRQFACKHLLPEEIKRLDQPLDFDGALTDGTYWSWINEKLKRIFLILVDLGIPDQIFGIVDDSWDDGDLPIPLDQVARLQLTAGRDERVDRKFYCRQYNYLLRHIKKGQHTVYSDVDVVPLDIVDKRTARGHYIDKVTLPNAPGQVLCRRRIPLGNEPGCLSAEALLSEINSIKNIQNDHLMSYWASYTYQSYGYVLFTPASEFSLHTLLSTPPTHLKSMDKHQKRPLVVNWVHCLVDTLSYLHSRRLSHGNIKPSTVLLDNENNIFLNDFARFNTEVFGSSAERSSFDKESYDYAAPEQWFKPGQSPTNSRRPVMPIHPLSALPENHSCGMNRNDSSSSAVFFNTPAPQLNPQAADVFSMGCVILELINFLMKKPRGAFAAHRAAKHKTAGRGGAVPDSSFHKNLGQSESWMKILSKEASKKDDAVMKAVPAILTLVADMLALAPENRPSAARVEQGLYQILTEVCKIREPHCVHQFSGWDFGLGRLHGSPTLETTLVFQMPSISRRPSSAIQSAEFRSLRRMNRSHSNSHETDHISPSWKVRERMRVLETPIHAAGSTHQDPLAC